MEQGGGNEMADWILILLSWIFCQVLEDTTSHISIIIHSYRARASAALLKFVPQLCESAPGWDLYEQELNERKGECARLGGRREGV